MALVAAVAAVAVALVAAFVLTQPDDSGVARPTPMAEATLPTIPPTTPRPEPDPCLGGADRAFTPETISVQDTTYPVLALPRDAAGVPGVPPLTQVGKWRFGWDGAPSPLPGSRQGHVLVNAHTYPDGSALGNLLLDRLDDGAILIARGEGQVQCYRVEREFEVPADSRDSGYENEDGQPRLAILVCSGNRNAAGDWSHRTIWFAAKFDASPSPTA